MAHLEAVTITGGRALVEEADVEEFQTSLRGELLRAGDDGYDEARKIYNAMIDRRPALIARCAGAADVVRCVNMRARACRQASLHFSPRSVTSCLRGASVPGAFGLTPTPLNQ